MCFKHYWPVCGVLLQLEPPVGLLSVNGSYKFIPSLFCPDIYPPSFPPSFCPPVLCSSPSLLSVYTVIAPQSSPSISIRDSTSSLPFSAQGYLQTDSCYIYWGMKLPLHPLRAPKRCSTVEKCNTNIGTKEGVEHAGGDEHNANHRFIKASKRGEVMLALISPRVSEILSKKLIWNWLDDGGGWWQAVQL